MTDQLPDEEEIVKTLDLSPTVRKILYFIAAIGSMALGVLGSQFLTPDQLQIALSVDGLLFTLATGKTVATRVVKSKTATRAVAKPAPAHAKAEPVTLAKADPWPPE